MPQNGREQCRTLKNYQKSTFFILSDILGLTIFSLKLSFRLETIKKIKFASLLVLSKNGIIYIPFPLEKKLKIQTKEPLLFERRNFFHFKLKLSNKTRKSPCTLLFFTYTLLFLAKNDFPPFPNHMY